MEDPEDQETIDNCLSVFNVYDDRGDGMIQAKLIGQVLRALDLNPTEAELAKCTGEMKPDERVSFETFMPIFQSLAKKPRDKNVVGEALIEQLRAYDPKETGHIPGSVLRGLLQSAGDPLTDEEMEQLLPSPDEPVNYEEFVRMVFEN